MSETSAPSNQPQDQNQPQGQPEAAPPPLGATIIYARGGAGRFVDAGSERLVLLPDCPIVVVGDVAGDGEVTQGLAARLIEDGHCRLVEPAKLPASAKEEQPSAKEEQPSHGDPVPDDAPHEEAADDEASRSPAAEH